MISTRTPVVETHRRVSQGFRNILLAVTKETAPTALDHVAALARPGFTRVMVLHLQERLTYPSRSGVVVIETYAEAVEFTARVRAELRELGVDAEVKVGREISGREAEQILLAAYDFGADLVIAGNRRKSGLDALLRGSTTRRLVHRSSIPLLLVS
jgi:nucleotide-binding universal stress UspA family protein